MLAHPSQHTTTPFTTGGAPLAQGRVLLIDDHPAVRMGARQLINDQPDMRVIAEAEDVSEALGRLEVPVDVAVVDYHLGTGRNGVSLAGHLKRRQPAPRVLLYFAFADVGLAVVTLIAGADGLLGKHELPEVLCYAIRRLARGRHHLPAIPPPVARAMGSRSRDQALYGMLLHGITEHEIAQRLNIAHEEVHARRSIMLRTLKPGRPPSARPAGARAPLDYERPSGVRAAELHNGGGEGRLLLSKGSPC